MVIHEDTPGAESFVPRGAALPVLASAVQQCRGCPLHRKATQAVFGAGRPQPSMVLLGEQPGEQEDREGLPFVGPSGRVLRELLIAADIDVEDVFLTNVVKHVYVESHGRRRVHRRPHGAMVAACRPWLEEELARTKPPVLVCLGAIATRAILGKDVRVTQASGATFSTTIAPVVIATLHPSALLRARTPRALADARSRMLDDLARARSHAARGR